jgi:nickel/cobalt transporter (NicO) family protein
MPIDPAFFIVLALALGFKHSYDADHLVAVSNLLTRSKDLRKTARMSVSWAAGHMVTATVITILLYEFRQTLLQGFLSNFDLLVAVMLLVIGVLGLLVEFGFLHRHAHEHATEEQGVASHSHLHLHLGRPSEHRTMFGIGIVHGLASNDELLILFVASLGVTSLLGLLGGVGVFSLGVVAGMILFGLGVSFPMLRWGHVRVRRVVNVVAAVLSIAYAVYLFLGYGGFNVLPVIRV